MAATQQIDKDEAFNDFAIRSFPSRSELTHSDTSTTSDFHWGQVQVEAKAFRRQSRGPTAATNQTLSEAPSEAENTMPSRADRSAGAVSEHEYKDMLEEHALLVTKSFEGTLSHREYLQMRMLEWSIDRADEAEYGPATDSIDFLVDMHKKLEDQVRKLVEAISA